jgi:hypothetical protein
MSDKKAKEVTIKPKTYLHIEIDEKGMINCSFNGELLTLRGLVDVARDHVSEQHSKVFSAKDPKTNN